MTGFYQASPIKRVRATKAKIDERRSGLLAIVSWSLVVNGHIFARALSIPFVAGIMLSLAYFFLNYLVFWQLGPPPA